MIIIIVYHSIVVGMTRGLSTPKPTQKHIRGVHPQESQIQFSAEFTLFPTLFLPKWVLY